MDVVEGSLITQLAMQLALTEVAALGTGKMSLN